MGTGAEHAGGRRWRAGWSMLAAEGDARRRTDGRIWTCAGSRRWRTKRRDGRRWTNTGRCGTRRGADSAAADAGHLFRRWGRRRSVRATKRRARASGSCVFWFPSMLKEEDARDRDQVTCTFCMSHGDMRTKFKF